MGWCERVFNYTSVVLFSKDFFFFFFNFSRALSHLSVITFTLIFSFASFSCVMHRACACLHQNFPPFSLPESILRLHLFNLDFVFGGRICCGGFY